MLSTYVFNFLYCAILITLRAGWFRTVYIAVLLWKGIDNKPILLPHTSATTRSNKRSKNLNGASYSECEVSTYIKYLLKPYIPLVTFFYKVYKTTLNCFSDSKLVMRTALSNSILDYSYVEWYLDHCYIFLEVI